MHADVEKNVRSMEERLDITFKDRDLLIEALTHRSYPNERFNHPTGHNERLEFLGDAVLEIIVTEFLYRKFPEAPEGELTEYRSALVNAKSLSSIAESFGVVEHMFMSKGERRDSAPSAKSRMAICANVFEAILGAIYLDQGMGESRMFVDNFLLTNLSRIIADREDPKSLFQNEMQERFGITPHYRVLNESGPDHKKQYLMGAYLNKILVAEGVADSKKNGQVAAAKRARETITQWEGRITEVSQKASEMRRSGNGGGQ